MQVKILGQFKDSRGRVFVAMSYPEEGETFLGIFWMKQTHDMLSIPNFVPVAVPWNITGLDIDKEYFKLLNRIGSESMKILPEELSLYEMSTMALNWIMSNI